MQILAFTAFLLFRYAATERARFEHDAVEIASQIALIIDGELQAMVALLRGLAASSALATDDLARFHAEATRLVEGQDQVIGGGFRGCSGKEQLEQAAAIIFGAAASRVRSLSRIKSPLPAVRLIVSDVYLRSRFRASRASLSPSPSLKWRGRSHPRDHGAHSASS